MSTSNTIRPRGRGRGTFRPKYVTRSNLHVIATHVPAAPIAKKKPILKSTKKETNLVPANSKSPSKNSSVDQEIKTSSATDKESGILKTETSLPKSLSDTPKPDLVSVKKETGVPKKDLVVQKKEEPQKSNSIINLTFSTDTTRKERQAFYALSNFVKLNELDKITPKRKSTKPKTFFTPKVLEIPPKTVVAPQNVKKAIKKDFVPSKKSVNQGLKTKPGDTKKATSQDSKTEPNRDKVPPYQKLNKDKKDSGFPSHPKADKPIGKKKELNKNATQQGKELSHPEEDSLGRQGGSKKARLDLSSNFEGHKRKSSFWDDGSNSREAYFLTEEDELASRKNLHSSRDYRSLEEEMYYKDKYKKSKKQDYKYKESESYDKYSWYSKDYKLKQKYEEEKYAFNEYSDYPGEEGDFEEVEDFEEVASVESKVPVYFRKCLVRYLPYKTFSYFRPKWYYISRKRYIVNCMYAAAKEGKITAEKERDTKENEENLIDENLHESGMEVSEEECLDNIEMIEVIPDDDIITEDISVHDEETISDDVSVHDEEIITDEVPAQDDSVEKDRSVSNKNDIKDATLNKEISTNNETVMSSDLKDSLKKDQNTENQTTPKKNLALEKENSIPVIDLSFESPEAKKVVNKPSSSVKTSDKGSLKNPEIVVKNMEVKVINLEEKDTLQEKSERSSEKDNEKNPSLVQSREFIKCNSSLPLNTDFNQGVAVIQSILADWKSHLIGLEYMLEIRTNVDEAVVKKYHCGLCGDDISVEKEVGQIVINHIISYKHMCNYMAKHFPSSDYKFSKSVRNYISEIVLQKCCEEINNKLGYNFMCIVKEDYFQNNGDKVKEHLNAMKHFSETDISIDPITTVSCLESDIQKDVVSLIDDVMKKIMIGEEKSSFFTPKTIVSNLRGSSVKDKKKELSKTIENTVSRNSQNALILLTPEHSQEVVSIQTTLADLKTSEKMAPISKRLPRRSNLLQVPVHDSSSINLESNKQPSVTTSSLTSVEINSPVKKVSPQKDLQMKKESNLEAAMSVDPDAGNADSGTEFSAKNSASFSKLKPQESASTAVPKTAGSDNETVRIVRIKTVANRSLKFDEEEDDDTPVFLLDSNVSKNKESESGLADPELVNTDSINAGYSDTLQGEEISDNDFSDNDFVDVASTGTEAAAYKSKSRIKQHAHQKGPHSKFCRKRIYRGKESSTDQESALNDANISGNIIPTVDRFKGRHFSTFVKKSDELSLDSSISSSSRRKRSPLRLSRSPSLEEFLRKLSPSPKRSKSPLRLSRKVPYRKRGSPIRRHSRSPYRRYSRSPRKRHSRSPYRKRSRSPIRRRSRSPFRKRSRSPARKRSRSPVRRRSRSPYKKHSRSPRRRISRSPMRKRSRSPVWSASKGHGVHKSRSPYRKIGVRKISRSPERIPIKLPVHRVISKSPTRRSKSPSSSYPHSRSPLRSESRLSKDSLYKYKKESARSSGSFENPPQSSYPLRRKESEVGQELNDLDEVSDEDESKYFTTTSDNPVYMDIIKKLPESARIMLVKVLQRFSITNINPNDPSFFELMKFVASHSTEIQRLMSQPSVFSEVNAPTQATSVQSQESLVHQYLLSTMKGNLNPNMPRESFPSTSGMPSASADIRFQQPPMQSTIPGLQFLPPNSGLPPNQFQPSVFQQSSPQPQYSMQNIQQPTPPQVQPQQLYANSPAEQQLQIQPPTYQTPSPQKPAPAPKKKVKSEVMFKDLKATVNKIFGGDDVLGRIGIRIPGFNDAPDQEKWQPNAPTIPKVNPEPQTSFQGNRSEMNFHDINEGPMKSSGNIPKNYSKVNEPYFEEMSRPEPYVPPPDAKVSFCDVQRSSQRNLFPVVNNSDTRLNYGGGNSQMSVNDAKKSLAQRLAAVLVKVGMTDVPAYLLQEMLMKIGAFSLNPPQDISEEEIIGILRKLKYL